MSNQTIAEFPEKLQFLFEPHRYKVAYGGRGSGKSWSMARALLIKAAKENVVGFSLHFCEGDHSWFFTINSVAPDEYWCGKNYSFDTAVACVLEQLELMDNHTQEKK